MTTQYKLVHLLKGKDQAVKRYHPWIFSGAVRQASPEINDGDIVEVFSASGEYLATGHYSKGSIAIRIISFQRTEINHEFWVNKLKQAYRLRCQCGLTDNSLTNAYRLVHAEGDGLSGLVIDMYKNVAVIQAHSTGMYMSRDPLTNALKEIFRDSLVAVFDKSSEALHGNQDVRNSFLYGSTENEFMVHEQGYGFLVDLFESQKTGFFIDQRENRKLLEQFCKGKKVLNTFCYTGGFSVYASRAGAASVHSVDSSKKAIEMTEKNLQLNGIDINTNQCIVSGTLEFLKDKKNIYDLIILDPPAYAKHLSARHNAVSGYRRLNALAIKNVISGGIIFTFSCSQVVDRKLFSDTITAAAIEAGRQVKILYHLSQPADHPVSIFHPEGAYLKGLVLQVS